MIELGSQLEGYVWERTLYLAAVTQGLGERRAKPPALPEEGCPFLTNQGLD